MERRDYLVREIEKMRAVIQKIFRMRVDREEEVPMLVSTELKRYFDLSAEQIQLMMEADFRHFIQDKNVSLTEFIGDLLYALVDLQSPPDAQTIAIFKKILITWEYWEAKTRTFDPEKSERKEKIIALLSKANY